MYESLITEKKTCIALGIHLSPNFYQGNAYFLVHESDKTSVTENYMIYTCILYLSENGNIKMFYKVNIGPNLNLFEFDSRI
jgi:hypothetical protein